MQNHTVALGEGVSWRRVGDDIVVLNLETSRYLSLNGSAGLLWEALDKEAKTVEELVELLVAEFQDVERSRAKADVESFLHSCESHGLLGPHS